MLKFFDNLKRDRHCAYNVTLRRVRVTNRMQKEKAMAC